MNHKTTDKWYIILNPTAGNGAVKIKWPKIVQLLDKNNIPYQTVETKNPGHAIDLAQQAIEDGFRKIIAVGGDGTNNEVVNGICRQKTVPSNTITYALLPVGTGNDWIKTHRIPKNFDLWIDKLISCNTTFQDVGYVVYQREGKQQSRYFANVAGMAYDAYIAKASEENRNKMGNRLFYLYLVFTCLFKYDLRPARITFDGETLEDHFYTINIGICKYSGGGMQFVPHAIPDDGKLALTIIRPMSKLGVMLKTPYMYSGKIAKLKEVSTHQVENIKIEPLNGKATLVEVDGEYLGEAPAEYKILKRALKIVI